MRIEGFKKFHLCKEQVGICVAAQKHRDIKQDVVFSASVYSFVTQLNLQTDLNSAQLSKFMSDLYMFQIFICSFKL